MKYMDENHRGKSFTICIIKDKIFINMNELLKNIGYNNISNSTLEKISCEKIHNVNICADCYCCDNNIIKIEDNENLFFNIDYAKTFLHKMVYSDIMIDKRCKKKEISEISMESIISRIKNNNIIFSKGDNILNKKENIKEKDILIDVFSLYRDFELSKLEDEFKNKKKTESIYNFIKKTIDDKNMPEEKKEYLVNALYINTSKYTVSTDDKKSKISNRINGTSERRIEAAKNEKKFNEYKKKLRYYTEMAGAEKINKFIARNKEINKIVNIKDFRDRFNKVDAIIKINRATTFELLERVGIVDIFGIPEEEYKIYFYGIPKSVSRAREHGESLLTLYPKADLCDELISIIIEKVKEESNV